MKWNLLEVGVGTNCELIINMKFLNQNKWYLTNIIGYSVARWLTNFVLARFLPILIPFLLISSISSAKENQFRKNMGNLKTYLKGNDLETLHHEMLDFIRYEFAGDADLQIINDYLKFTPKALNFFGKSDRSLLMIVASMRKGRESLFDLLITKKNIQISLENSMGEDALHFALYSANYHAAFALIALPNIKINHAHIEMSLTNRRRSLWREIFLKKEVALDHVLSSGTPVILKVFPALNEEDVVKLLNDTKTLDQNQFDHTSGNNLLHLASRYGMDSVIKILIEKLKFNVNLQNFSGESPLMLAVFSERDKVVKSLLKSPDLNPNLMNSKGETALYQAIDRGDRSVIEILVSDLRLDPNITSDGLYTPLQLASTHEVYSYLVEILLKAKNIDVNLTSRYSKKTPLMLAVGKDKVHAVERLLNTQSIDVNKGNDVGWTPLMEAAYNGSIKSLEKLLRHPNININAVSDSGWTAITAAIERDRLDIAKILIQNPNIEALLKAKIQGNYDFLAKKLGYLDNEESLRNYIINEKVKVKYPVKGYPSVSTPSKVLMVDEISSEVNYQNLMTQDFIFQHPISFEDNFIQIDSVGSHGDIIANGLLRPGILGLNYIEIINSNRIDNQFDCDNHTNINKLQDLIEIHNPDLVNISCGDLNFEERMKGIAIISKFAEKNKLIIIQSAGNYSKSIHIPPGGLSDFYFLIGSSNDDNRLYYKNKDKGSNYGQAVDFAATSTNIKLPRVATPNRFDQKIMKWGGTSYSTAIVSGLVARIINYLPDIVKEYPYYIKNILIQTGDHSQALVNKLKNPIVINPRNTMRWLKDNLFFRFHVRKNELYVKCDKRLLKIVTVEGNEKDCSTGWINLGQDYTDKEVILFGIYLPVYSKVPNFKCRINFKKHHRFFTNNEGILTCT